jgi:hypothetical protein
MRLLVIPARFLGRFAEGAIISSFSGTRSHDASSGIMNNMIFQKAVAIDF